MHNDNKRTVSHIDGRGVIHWSNFETLVLALYCYRGDNVKCGVLSKSYSKESNNMAVEKTLELQ